MRALLALVLLGGCINAGVGPSGSGTRPGVMPLLSELPNDAAKRNAVLDASANVAGPEQRSGLTVKERAAETAGATAAAILGGLFSKTKNVTLGGATVIDEGPIAAPRPAPHAGPPRTPSADPVKRDPIQLDPSDSPPADAAPPVEADPPSADLVPWIKLR